MPPKSVFEQRKADLRHKIHAEACVINTYGLQQEEKLAALDKKSALETKLCRLEEEEDARRKLAESISPVESRNRSRSAPSTNAVSTHPTNEEATPEHSDQQGILPLSPEGLFISSSPEPLPKVVSAEPQSEEQPFETPSPHKRPLRFPMLSTPPLKRKTNIYQESIMISNTPLLSSLTSPDIAPMTIPGKTSGRPTLHDLIRTAIEKELTAWEAHTSLVYSVSKVRDEHVKHLAALEEQRRQIIEKTQAELMDYERRAAEASSCFDRATAERSALESELKSVEQA